MLSKMYESTLFTFRLTDCVAGTEPGLSNGSGPQSPSTPHRSQAVRIVRQAPILSLHHRRHWQGRAPYVRWRLWRHIQGLARNEDRGPQTHAAFYPELGPGDPRYPSSESIPHPSMHLLTSVNVETVSRGSSLERSSPPAYPAFSRN